VRTVFELKDGKHQNKLRKQSIQGGMAALRGLLSGMRVLLIRVHSERRGVTVPFFPDHCRYVFNVEAYQRPSDIASRAWLEGAPSVRGGEDNGML